MFVGVATFSKVLCSSLKHESKLPPLLRRGRARLTVGVWSRWDVPGSSVKVTRDDSGFLPPQWRLAAAQDATLQWRFPLVCQERNSLAH